MNTNIICEMVGKIGSCLGEGTILSKGVALTGE